MDTKNIKNENRNEVKKILEGVFTAEDLNMIDDVIAEMVDTSSSIKANKMLEEGKGEAVVKHTDLKLYNEILKMKDLNKLIDRKIKKIGFLYKGLGESSEIDVDDFKNDPARFLVKKVMESIKNGEPITLSKYEKFTVFESLIKREALKKFLTMDKEKLSKEGQRKQNEIYNSIKKTNSNFIEKMRKELEDKAMREINPLDFRHKALEVLVNFSGIDDYNIPEDVWRRLLDHTADMIGNAIPNHVIKDKVRKWLNSKQQEYDIKTNIKEDKNVLKPNDKSILNKKQLEIDNLFE